MAYVSLSAHGITPFERLLGHCPSILDKWQHLEEAIFQSQTFSSDFLEQIRRALAYKNACQYCMLKAGPPNEDIEESRLLEALSAANKFAIDYTTFGKNEIERLNIYFSETEIIELIAFFSFVSAVQKFNAVLGLQEASDYN